MDVTVAICTWNRAALLDRTLGSLAGLRVPPGVAWEVVVVDNNCTDGTQAVLTRHAKAGAVPLRPVREEKQGHSHARNRALAEAAGEWVVWTDDDVQVLPDWLAEFRAAAGRHPAAAAVGGPVDPWFPVPPDPALAAAFDQVRTGYCGVDHGPAERELAPGEDVFGANMAFHRGRTAGLRFDPRLGRNGPSQAGGDDLAFLRLARDRGPVVWAPGMRVRHYVDPARVTVGYVRKFFRDSGRSIVETGGVPAGRRVLGVPKWLAEKCLEHRARAAWLRVRRGRVAALREMRKAWTREGMALACFDRWRRGAEVPAPQETGGP